MSHFLIVTYPHESCGWVATFPDFVGVTGRAAEMGLAMWRATKAAQQVCEVLAQLDQPLPTPTDLVSVQRKHVWANVYGIDWSTAVVRSVRLSDTSQAAATNGAGDHAARSATVPEKRGPKSNGSVPEALTQAEMG